MLTTTPFRKPREGCVPSPMTFNVPSLATSATSAAIFDVPMSRPTIRSFLSSLVIVRLRLTGPPWFRSRAGLFHDAFAKAGNARREAVPVTQVDVLDSRPLARQRADGPRVHGDKALQTRGGLVAAELERQRPVAAARADPPAAARRNRQLADFERQRREHRRPLAVARRHLPDDAVRTGKPRQRRVGRRDERLAERVDQPAITEAGDGRVFLDRDLEARRPMTPQRDAANPGHAADRRARSLQVHREERACELVADDRLDVRA